MTKFRLTILFLLLSSPLVAQSNIIIHGSSQKSIYNDPSEWPLTSLQVHWNPSNDMCLNNIGTGLCADFNSGETNLLIASNGHIHAECNAPLWGEFQNQTITIPCQFVFYHLSGGIGPVWSDSGATLIWPDGKQCNTCQVNEHPPMGGDPMGVVTYQFKLRIVPWDSWFSAGYTHGWVSALTSARVYLTNGTIFDFKFQLPFYAAWDLTAPELNPNCDGCGPVLGSRIAPHPGDVSQWGEVTAFTRDVLPILGQITQPVTNLYDVHAYGQSGGGNPVYVAQSRNSINLHGGITGTLNSGPVTGDSSGNGSLLDTLHPTDFASTGTKHAIIWSATTGEGNANFKPHESVAALIVFTISGTGDGVIIPPVTCQDPLANNIGQPLPCTYPVITPPSDTPFNPSFLETPDHHFKITNPNTGTIKVIQ